MEVLRHAGVEAAAVIVSTVPDELLTLPSSNDEAIAALRGKRLGLPREYFVAGMEPGVEARVREAVGTLERAGAIVEQVSLPHTEYGLATYDIVAPAEASASLTRYDGIRDGARRGDGAALSVSRATRGSGVGAQAERRRGRVLGRGGAAVLDGER